MFQRRNSIRKGITYLVKPENFSDLKLTKEA